MTGPQDDATDWQHAVGLAVSVDRVRLLLGPDFGGSWIDNDTQTWHVQVTSRDVRQTALRLTSDLPLLTGHLEVHTVTYPRAALERWQDLVDDLMLTPAGEAITGSHLDEVANRVVVLVRRGTSAQIASLVRAVVPGDAVRLEEGEAYYVLDGPDG